MHHSEQRHGNASAVEEVDITAEDIDRMDKMLEAIRPEVESESEETPTPEVQKFFDLLKASEEPLHEHT